MTYMVFRGTDDDQRKREILVCAGAFAAMCEEIAGGGQTIAVQDVLCDLVPDFEFWRKDWRHVGDVEMTDRADLGVSRVFVS